MSSHDLIFPEKYHQRLLKNQRQHTKEIMQRNHATHLLIVEKEQAKFMAQVKKELTQKQQQEEQRLRLENAEKERLEQLREMEENRWQPCTTADKYIWPRLNDWNLNFKSEKEKFYHAAFVVTWFIHPKHGICFTGGIERWGKDKGKLKPFGGRREKKENRRETAARELREETAGLVQLEPADVGELPHVFIMRTNPCYLYETKVDHFQFRKLVREQKDSHCQEMKAIVHIPFREFHKLNLQKGIPGKGIRMPDVTGRKTHVSAFFLHSLRGFGFI